MNRFLLFPFFYLLCSLSFLQFPTFAEEKSYGEYKEWSELSQEEKDGLLARWTKEKVMKVVEALKEGGALSEFVNKIPLSEEEIKRLESLELSLDKAKNYDLRGIPLNKQNLQKVELPFVHLEGANLNKADLDGADLFESKLQGAKLNGATLKGADLTRTKLQGADLSDTELQEADLGGANLEGADLSDSDLKGADFFEANLKDANLSFANLRGAILSGANLQGTDLFNADFDRTHLWRANFGEAKNIRYVVWGGKTSFRITKEDLEGLKSDRVPKKIITKLESLQNKEFLKEDEFTEALNETIGKEGTKQYKSLILSYALATKESQSFYIGEEKEMNFQEDFKNAEITYRDLQTTYENESLDEIADEFNFRENEVITKDSPLPLRILRTLFLKWTYGYGSRPLWLLWFSLGVVGVFTIIFALLTLLPKTKSGVYIVRGKREEEEDVDQEEVNKNEERLSFRNRWIFIECFYFSLLSFATFGFDILQPRQWLEFFRLRPVKFKPVGWARILVGIEATFGIYVLALLLVAVVGYL